jgi:tetratricopeptide (TPR) repeat protein
MSADGRVAGYLGRVLDEDGDPAGTCFQVAPGVLVTAWHVLDELGAAEEQAVVQVDPLAGGDGFEAVVARLDHVHDLAVLQSATALAAVCGALTPTERMEVGAPVVVTGHAVIADPGYVFRWLDAPGTWAGGTTRDDSVALGRMSSSDVMPGMSGAPVIRTGDGTVAGVTSGRYNSADGWLAGSVWVARIEDLLPLLDGVAEVQVHKTRLQAPVDVVLAVTPERVRLTGPGIEVTAAHSGVRPGLAEAINEVRRGRARQAPAERQLDQARAAGGIMALGRVSRLLGESFLPEPVMGGLGQLLDAATADHQPVRLGLDIVAGLTGLPWESLPGLGGLPLALHPLVSVYRKTAGAAPGRLLPGPLRIVVAIAAPEHGGGPVLDYERELRNVLAEVRAARQDAADVRVVPFATPAAIRAELARGPVHVLHITGHGTPGKLMLEIQDGASLPVTADELIDQAIPAGQMPPVITLAACYTDVITSKNDASFAARLCQRGAAAVIATESAVTDIYATRLLARLYGALAADPHADVVAALASARRQVQDELTHSADRREQLVAALDEWATVTVLAATGSVAVLDTATTAPVSRPSRRRMAGMASRDDWYFVGRRAEQRRWPTDLLAASGPAGIVIHAIGGAGKTTLAAELATCLHDQDPARIQISLTGPLTLEGLLGTITSALRRALLVRGDQTVVAALDVVARTDVGWADRLAVLREHVLDHVPVLVVLDNFEDNLRAEGTSGYAVGDEVLGGLLAAWVADPGRSRLLITCRHPFSLPGGAQTALWFRPLGALSRAETMKLAWSLPALDELDETQLDQVWRHTGGHPRSLEYLDALLAGGTARYPDVTTRLQQAIGRRLSQPDSDRWQQAATSLDAALAQTITLAADDILLDDLLTRVDQVPGALDALVGISVYREPVDPNAVLFQAGQPDPGAENIPDRNAASQRIRDIVAAAGIPVGSSLDLSGVPAHVREQLAPHLQELNRLPVPPFTGPPGLAGQLAACQAASLLHADHHGHDQRFFVHRWTATELSARPASQTALAHAHRRAAGYWRWRVRVWPQDRAADVHDLLEARHHLLQAGDIEEAGQVTETVCAQLHEWGAWDQEASLIHDTLTRLPADSPRQAVWIHQLGVVAQYRGDYDEAARQYQRALDINERLGDQAGMARSYHQLGRLAGDRGDYEEAARQYQRSLDISERLGDQAGMASSYHQLGVLAQLRGDYDEAARQYQRALDIKERLGDQAGMASSHHQLGILAQNRGDYDEAVRQYQRALDIDERLGNQAGMASTYSQMGVLARDRGGPIEQSIALHMRALAIRFGLGVPEAVIDQRSLAAYRRELGDGTFGHLIAQTGSDPELTSALGPLLDQVDAAENAGAGQDPCGTDPAD